MHKNAIGKIAQQLALAIPPYDTTTLDDFCWGNNIELQQQIHATLQGHGERQIYLWGSPGCGKSHLLQACCQALPSTIYLPLKILQTWDSEILEGIEAQALISIDDIDVIHGHPRWEEALFHFYNRVRDQGHSILLMTGQKPPAQIPFTLPDLRSRVSWGLVMHMHELNDEDKVRTLRVHALKRGLELSDSVGQFLLNRCARNMHDLYHLLNSLDTASWQTQRKITIPFVKEILKL